MGERLQNITETGKIFNTTNTQSFNYLGDRAYFYIQGTTIFLENPITGIGLNNFTQVNQSNYRLHSEYMVQITEGGVVGSSFFLLFNLWILLNLFKSYKDKSDLQTIILVLLGGFAAILFINITAWTYQFSHYFICFGIIISYLKIPQSKKSNLVYQKNYMKQ